MGVVFSHKLLLLSFSPNDSTSGGGRAVTTTGSGRLVTCDRFGAQLNGGVCGYRRRVAVTPASGLGAGAVHAGRARKAYRRVSVRVVLVRRRIRDGESAEIERRAVREGTEKGCRLRWSTQHLLGVYSPEFGI